MRATLLRAMAVCLAATNATAQNTQPGGGKKHHKTDSASASSAQTLKGGATVSQYLTFQSDPAFVGGTTVSSGETAASEVLAVSHVAPDTAPKGYEFTWKLDNDRGTLYFRILPGGSWQLNGTYNDKKQKDRDLEVAFAVKLKHGDVFIFHFIGPALKGKHFVAAYNGAFLLSDAFASLEQYGFEIRGAYRIPTTAEGTPIVNAGSAQGACQTPATLAAGWAPIWSWTDKHSHCVQFNTLGQG